MSSTAGDTIALTFDTEYVLPPPPGIEGAVAEAVAAELPGSVPAQLPAGTATVRIDLVGG